MLPRSVVVRSSPIHRVLACLVIGANLGTPALAVAAEAPVTTQPISNPWSIPPPAPEAKIESAKPSSREERKPNQAQAAPNPMRVEYDTNTHAAISDVAIHRTDCLADNYLKTRLLMSSGINTSSTDGTPAELFRQAAIDEDGSVNFFRHFYDPAHNDVGLTDGGGWFSNSMQWAWNGHDQDWRVARQAFFEAVTQTLKTARAFHMARSFYALGHVAHLVEDLAQPQHVRNDAHLVHPYESYCRDHYGDATAVAGLGNQAPPAFTVMSSPFSEIPPEFAAFWDTGQYYGQTGITSFAGTLGLEPVAKGESTTAPGARRTRDRAIADRVDEVHPLDHCRQRLLQDAGVAVVEIEGPRNDRDGVAPARRAEETGILVGMEARRVRADVRNLAALPLVGHHIAQILAQELLGVGQIARG